MGKTHIGQGKQALALGGGGVTGYVNTSGAVAYTTTTVTPTASPAWTVSTTTNFGSANVWTGFIVVAGGSATGGAMSYGVITSNTATALTIDRWYNAASPTGAVGTQPANNSTFIIIPGNAPAWYMGITNGAAAVTDTALASEQTTNGLGRAPATFAHTFSSTVIQNTYTLTNTFTYTGTGALTLNSIGIFDALTNGVPLFTTGLSAAATVTASGDAVTCTDTVTM
jgi:hypothetical protein